MITYYCITEVSKMPFNLCLMYFLPPPFPPTQQLHEIVICLKEPWFYLFIGSLVSRIMDDKYMIISPSGNYKNQLHFK